MTKSLILAVLISLMTLFSFGNTSLTTSGTSQARFSESTADGDKTGDLNP